MISLQKVGDAIKFTFQDNPLYLNDGTIEVPVNSLSLLIDESDIATFKKNNGDAFLCCSLDELNMTKEQLIAFYKDNMVGDGGMTPEEVEDIVESATTNLFGYAEYDSQNTRINFKHDASGSVISYIDASDFVIDGMIDNVEIVTVQGVKYLKITFNTESGKEPILIPLSDIFNPSDYYTKTEVDNAISAATSGKADTSAVTEAIAAAVSGKADTSAVTEAITAAVSGKSDTVELTQAEYDALVDKDPNTFYIISDADPININNYYTKSETDGKITAAVSGKQETLVSGTNIKTINNTSILGSGNIDIQGGGVNVVQTTGTSTTDVMSQNAVTNIQQNLIVIYTNGFDGQGRTSLNAYKANGSGNDNLSIFATKINGKNIIAGGYSNRNGIPVGLSLVETSAITTSVTSASTDSQVPSAKAVYDAIQEGGGSITVDNALDSGSTNPVQNKVLYNKIDEIEEVTAAGINAVNDKFGGLSIVKLTQAEYDALTVKDNNVLYIVI